MHNWALLGYGDTEPGGGGGVHRLDRYPFRKNEKITRTVPILKSNSTYFSLRIFFYDGY